MADDFLDALVEQKLCCCQDQWVTVVYDSNFTEFEGLDQAFQDIDLNDPQFSHLLLRCADTCLKMVDGDVAGVWQTMSDRQLSPKALLVLLFYCIENGLRKESTNANLVLSLAACQFYLALTSLPGAQAYSVFNSFLYLKTVDCAKSCLRRISRAFGGPNMTRGPAARGRGRGSSSMRGGKGKKSAGRKNAQQTSVDDTTHFNDENMDDIMDGLEKYMQSLWSFLDKVSMKNQEACLGSTVSMLCNELLIWDGEKSSHFGEVLSANTVADLRYMAEKSFACLHKATSKIQDSCGRLVLRCLMPRLLLLNLDGAHVGQAPTAPTIKLRDLAVKFIFELMKRVENEPNLTQNNANLEENREQSPEVAENVGENEENINENEGHANENEANNAENRGENGGNNNRKKQKKNKRKSVALTSIHHSVCRLLRFMCTKVPDKIEFRNKTAQTIALLLGKLKPAVYSDFLEDFEKFANSKQMGYRGFAADLTPMLLECREDRDNEVAAKRVARILLFRACDKAPTVRQRALGHLATLLNGDNEVFIRTVMETSVKIEPSKKRRNNPQRNVDESDESTVIENESGFGAVTVTLNWIVVRRSCDDKVIVRKVAVQLAHSILIVTQIDAELTNILKRRCSDCALSVRKQAAESLTDILLRFSDCAAVQKAWLEGVVPMVIDRESSAMDKAVELIANVIFKNLNDAGSKRDLAWKLLVNMERQKSLQRYLQRAVRKMIDNKAINERLAVTIEAEIKIQERAPACWMLLAELSSGLQLSPRGTRVAWYENDGQSDRTVSYMARILANATKRMSVDEADELLLHMKAKIESFCMSPDCVAAVIYAISHLIKRLALNEEKGVQDCQKWCNNMSHLCERYLAGLVFNEEASVGPGHYNETAISRHLATLGEVVQYVHKMASKRVFVILEALVASEHLHVQFSNMQRTGQWHSLSRPQSNATNQQANSQPERPPSSVSPSLQAMPLSIRSNAVNTLGKMCLQDEDSAKKCVAALVRELAVNKEATIRNNIMVVLSDLCIRYTSLVDRHVGTISRCLKDPSTLVRRQTLSLLTVLLKEDFLKWKGVLLYRFVSTLLDKDPNVRQFTQFCLINVLLSRHESMFSLHFLECVFYFNGVCHPSWEAVHGNVLSVGREDAALFSLRGKNRREERMQLYKFMIRQFSDFEKLNTAAKLSVDVLGCIVDEVIPFNKETEELLSDALVLLACKEMKMKTLQSSKHNEDEEEAVQQAVNEVQKKMLTQTVKKAIKENVIPCAVALKHFLETKRSPAEKLLLIYLRDLMKEHNNEIMEVLASDKQTANEIEYDLKRLEQEEKDAEMAREERERKKVLEKDRQTARERTLVEQIKAEPPEAEPQDAPMENVDVPNGNENNDADNQPPPQRTPLREVPGQEGEEGDSTISLRRKKKRKTTMPPNSKLKLIKEEPAEMSKGGHHGEATPVEAPEAAPAPPPAAVVAAPPAAVVAAPPAAVVAAPPAAVVAVPPAAVVAAPLAAVVAAPPAAVVAAPPAAVVAARAALNDSDLGDADESGFVVPFPMPARAISTPEHPSQMMNDLTFQISADVSAIGPAPETNRRSGRKRVGKQFASLSFMRNPATKKK